VNYELTKSELKINLKLIVNKLRINLEWTKS
jgi:hypothetical protein